MKNIELEQVLKAIETLKDVKLSAKMSLTLIKNVKKIKEAWASIDELRLELCKKYAEKDENGQIKLNKEKTRYIFPSEQDENELNIAYTNLLQEESTIVFDKFTVKDIEEIKELTPIQAEALLYFAD